MRFMTGLDGWVFPYSLDTAVDPRNFEYDVTTIIETTFGRLPMFPDQTLDLVVYGFPEASRLLHEPRMGMMNRMYPIARFQHPEWSASRMAHELMHEVSYELRFEVIETGRPGPGMKSFDVRIPLTGEWNDIHHPTDIPGLPDIDEKPPT